MTEEKKTRKAKTVEDVVAENPEVLLQAEKMKASMLAHEAQQRKALRDEFAKAALTGLLAHHGNPNLRSLADAAYQYADFMMEIRNV